MTALAIGAVVCAIVLASLAVMLYFAAIAPLGYEDSDGWHPGEDCND